MPKRKRGALKGNQNARKHGFYSKVLDEAELLGRRFGLNRPISRTLAKRRGRNDRDNGWGKKKKGLDIWGPFRQRVVLLPG